MCAALKSPFLIFLVQVIYASSYFCTEGSARNSSPWLLGPLGIFFSFVCSLGLCSSYWGIFGGSIPKAEEEIGTASPGPSLAADGLPVFRCRTTRKPVLVSPLQLKGGGNSTHLFSILRTREIDHFNFLNHTVTVIQTYGLLPYTF